MDGFDIAAFSDRRDADNLKVRLDAKGFHSQVHDQSGFQKYWFLAGGEGAYRVEVAKGEEYFALHWMRNCDEPDDPWRAAMHCPECHSTRVEFPQFTRKSFTTSIFPILFAKLFHLQRFYCEDCHHTWSKETHEPHATPSPA